MSEIERSLHVMSLHTTPGDVWLPQELWERVVGHLPIDGRRTCLFVSRAFHDHAVRCLFSTVHIFFGAWEDYNVSNDAEEVGDTRSIMSFEILRRIALDGSFAVVIKKVVVHAFTMGRGVFERLNLIEALRRLHNLTSFTWLGLCPRLSSDVVDTLATSCPWLEQVSIPIPMRASLPLHRLIRLTSIILSTWCEEEDEHYLDDDVEEIRRVIETNCGALKEMEINGRVFHAAPVKNLSHLTHLELYDAVAENLEPLLQHCPQLQSLMLFPRPNCISHFITMLASNKSSFPCLTSFKLVQDDGDTWMPAACDISSLIEFLQAKPKMRRFDCKLYSTREILVPLLRALPTMKALRILGLSLHFPEITQDDVQTFDPRFCATLTALRLRLGSETTTVNKESVLSLWALFTQLQFTSLIFACATELTVQELVQSGSGRLKLINYNGKMHPIERSDNDVEVLGPWSERKSAFRSVDDLGEDDWDWVIRHYSA
ncbi:uncharacterized protein FIBRA_05587 [Fibroporia radiculosa]|uniref:F-box domain-containing protein n=1 Tax=Fibroporia radiculosa TaxID=599839 RepID=J4H3L5_9APHY|nr:uncharacterized protein FIBRA_05587 [Fibroporia radiculosa]CCM03454.1 predicted protein [Fibroporia radiculosa]